MIDLNSLTKAITVKDVKDIMEMLDADFSQETDTEIKYRTICHCGNKHKLYFYKESMSFYCYSECGRIGSIIDLVNKVKEFDNIYSSAEWICNKLGISTFKEGSFGNKDIDAPRIDDWSYINFLKGKQKMESKKHEFEILDEKILNMFQNFHPLSWVEEDGITHEAMDTYEIKYCAWQERVVLPHRDKDGNLIGLRGRANSDDAMMFGKYVPLLTGNMSGKTYAHNLGNTLYGLHLNKDCIKRTRKILLMEAEKSIMQMASFFSIENNYSVAICGSNLTKAQIKLILELAPLEVIVGLDKQFEVLGDDECKQWEKKILEKFIKPLSPYCKVSVLWDTDNLLDYKDSPSDKGKETFLKLMENRQFGWCY